MGFLAKKQVAGFNKARAFRAAHFILRRLVMSANLAMFLADPKNHGRVGNDRRSASWASGWGRSGNWVLSPLFENRSWSYILVNGGLPRRGLCRDGRHPRRLAGKLARKRPREDSGLTAVVFQIYGIAIYGIASSRSRTKEGPAPELMISITAGRSAPARI